MSKTTLLILAGVGALLLIFFMGRRSEPGASASVLNPKGPPPNGQSIVGDIFNTGIGIANDVVDLITKVNNANGSISSSGGSAMGDGVYPPSF